MPITELQRKNIEASIAELNKDLDTIVRFRLKYGEDISLPKLATMVKWSIENLEKELEG